jgi:hypothetical protein
MYTWMFWLRACPTTPCRGLGPGTGIKCFVVAALALLGATLAVASLVWLGFAWLT